MKNLLYALLAGFPAGLGVSIAQSLDAPDWVTASSAVVGGFLGAFILKKLAA
ncbi:putative membrane protein (plasmid) [Sinorhizobium sp. RAC02]|nr:putative membrane protein [Sinorhizobium sp. RAC02]